MRQNWNSVVSQRCPECSEINPDLYPALLIITGPFNFSSLVKLLASR